MKKSVSMVLALVTVALLLSSCMTAFPTKKRVAAQTSEEAAKLLKDRTEKEIRDNWGEPDGVLSGFYGDIYVYGGRIIVIYYDADSKVAEVLVDERQI